MPKLKTLLASLVLSSSLAACAAGHAAPAKPAPQQVELDRAQVRARLAERRAQTIEHFLAYREARVYPINDVGPGKRHVWIDALGNLCAAATLISYDWGVDATARVGTENNAIELAKVKQGPLLDWILTSGLTHHEIVAIQVPGDFGTDIPRQDEIQRLYTMYQDVERQLRGLEERNLDLATDALMKRPDLARALLAGKVAGAGKYAQPPVG